MEEFHTKWMGRKRYHKAETVSTNVDIRLLGEQGAVEGTIVSADAQTDGRGRRGRSWQTEAGTSLLFSVLLRPELVPDTAPQITLIMAMAVTKAIRHLTGLEPKIKWPNDVVVNSKKVCGILTEMQLKNGGIDYVVVGTGVNVNQREIPEELMQSATSLLLEKRRQFMAGQQFMAEQQFVTGQQPAMEELGVAQLDREKLLAEIAEAFEDYYECFLQTKDLSYLMTKYNEWLVSRRKEVRVLDPKGEFTGISKGINEKGELLVELPNGEVTAIYAGEVSVRGLYGYV